MSNLAILCRPQMAPLGLYDRYRAAVDLLDRAAVVLEEHPPDVSWLRDFYLLTGDHMILTDEGWQSGDGKNSVIEQFGNDAIYDEVNALPPTYQEVLAQGHKTIIVDFGSLEHRQELIPGLVA
jgi:hypothetical protein